MDKKQEIIKAAEAVFLKFGIRKITLDDIARACGMKKTALYYYFKNKDAIIVAMLENNFAELFNKVKAEVDKEEGVQNRLKAFMRTRINEMRANLPLIKLFQDEDNLSMKTVKLLEENRTIIVNKDFCLIQEILSKGIENKKISYELNDSLVLMIMGVTYGAFVGKFIENSDWEIDKMIDTTIDVIFNGIK